MLNCLACIFAIVEELFPRGEFDGIRYDAWDKFCKSELLRLVSVGLYEASGQGVKCDSILGAVVEQLHSLSRERVVQ